VVFDEDSFPLAASPSLTDLNFLCKSGLMISTIGIHLTTAGTSTLAPRQPAPKIHPGFEPSVAPLPAPAIPPGFLPREATMAARPLWRLRMCHARPDCATCRHRRPATSYMAGLTDCLRPARGGSQSRWDTWHPRSCPTSGGGCWSPDDTWHPQSCPEPGGGSRSRGDTWCPWSCPASGGECWSPGDTWRPPEVP
jgi:hypothetical protein